LASEFGNERGGKSSDTVTVQKSEDVLLVLEVKDDTVSITVQRTTAISRTSLGRRRCALVSLDKIGTTLSWLELRNRIRFKATHLVVQALGLVNVIVDNLDIQTTIGRRWKVLEQFTQLRTSNTVCAVNSQVALRLCVFHGLLESSRQLLVVALLADLTVLILSALCVDAADQVVELRGGEDSVVGDLSAGGSQGVVEAFDQAGTGGASVTGKDDSGRGIEVDLERLDEVVVDLDEMIVGLGVGELSSVFLP
jgi:hypothetical protein